jgi:hypothetical protein
MCSKESYSKVLIGKYFYDSFPIQNGLKQGDALLPPIFNFALNTPLGRYKETGLD